MKKWSNKKTTVNEKSLMDIALPDKQGKYIKRIFTDGKLSYIETDDSEIISYIKQKGLKDNALPLEETTDPTPIKKKTDNELNQGLKDNNLTLEELQELLVIQALKINSSRWDNFKSLFTG